MKTTKVYSGPGYPIDPRLEEARRWKTEIEWTFVMERPSDICSQAVTHRIISWCVIPPSAASEVREIERQRACRAILEQPDDTNDYQNQELASNDRVDRLNHAVDRDERKRRQKKFGQLFVKYGIEKP